MNPLFTAHIVADFLLQPNWLVTWKEKSSRGILFHALVHALTMSVLVLPYNTNVRAVLVILIITGLHALIDKIKIIYQRKTKAFSASFFLDQLVHLAVLSTAIVLSPIALGFWKTEAGQGILIVLLFFSISLGMWHILHLKKYPVQSSKQRISRIILMAAVFLMFFIPAKLFGASSCFSL